MPTVKSAKGKAVKKFDYDTAGEAAAERYAKKTGGKMTMAPGVGPMAPKPAMKKKMPPKPKKTPKPFGRM